MFTDSENTKKLVKPDNEQRNDKKEKYISYMKKLFGNSFFGASYITSDFMTDFITDTDIFDEDE